MRKAQRDLVDAMTARLEEKLQGEEQLNLCDENMCRALVQLRYQLMQLGLIERDYHVPRSPEEFKQHINDIVRISREYLATLDIGSEERLTSSPQSS